MELGEPDQSGRRRPVPIPDSEYEIPCQVFIEAIGTRANPLLTQSYPELRLNKWGNIEVDDDMMTSMPGVFAGGDAAAIGYYTAIEAVAAGRRGAAAIHNHLRGEVPHGHTVAFPGTILYDERNRLLIPDSGWK